MLPYSLLIFAVVADLFNMAIINNPDFTGHVINEETSSKISAFADDTAVHMGSIEDIKSTMRPWEITLRQQGASPT